MDLVESWKVEKLDLYLYYGDILECFGFVDGGHSLYTIDILGYLTI